MNPSSYCVRPDCSCSRATCYEVDRIEGDQVALRSPASGAGVKVAVEQLRDAVARGVPLRVGRGLMPVSVMGTLLSDLGLA